MNREQTEWMKFQSELTKYLDKRRMAIELGIDESVIHICDSIYYNEKYHANNAISILNKAMKYHETV